MAYNELTKTFLKPLLEKLMEKIHQFTILTNWPPYAGDNETSPGVVSEQKQYPILWDQRKRGHQRGPSFPNDCSQRPQTGMRSLTIWHNRTSTLILTAIHVTGVWGGDIRLPGPDKTERWQTRVLWWRLQLLRWDARRPRGPETQGRASAGRTDPAFRRKHSFSKLVCKELLGIYRRSLSQYQF